MAAADSDIQWRFYLTSTATPQTEILEPANWPTFKSELKRDRKAHGIFYRFSASTILLGFAGTGRTILENEWQNYGFDGTVTLLAQSRSNEWATWETRFTGTAVFANREYDKDYFHCDFEDSAFIEKIKNRFDIKIGLDATTDLDGNAISTAITTSNGIYNALRTGAEFTAYFRASPDPTLSVNLDSNNQGGSGDVTRYWWPEFVSEQKTDATTEMNPNEPANWSASEPAHTDEFFDFSAGGSVTFSVSPIHFRLQLDNACSTGASPLMLWDYSWVLKHYNSAGSLQSTYNRSTAGLSNWGRSPNSMSNRDSICPAKDGSADTGEVSKSLSPITFDVSTNDKLVFYIEAHISDSDAGGDITADFELDFYEDSFENLAYLTPVKKYYVFHYLIYDVLNFLVRAVTGTSNGVHSVFYKLTDHGAPTDGCAGLRTITNGFSLRGQGNKVPRISLKELLTSLAAIDNIGWGMEDNYIDEAWSLRVEPMEYFYSDAEIANLGTVDDFVATIDDELVFNQVKVGYTKSAKGDDTLPAPSNDDFLTTSEYAMPFTSVKGTKSIMSTLIASGHIITTALAEQANKQDTWRHDDDNFIIIVVRDGVVSNRFNPENNENLDANSGFADATSIYNARIAPVFMFLAHAMFINSATLGKNITTQKYTNQFVALNRDFSATIGSAFACQDPEGLARTSSGDILIQNLNYGWRLFEPTIHKFQLALTQTQIDTIIDKLVGDTITTNYGYLTYKDEEGNTETGYPLKITYGVNEIAEFECIERSDQYLEQ